MREKRGHHLLVAAHDRLVERCKPGSGRVGVGALVEQQLDNPDEARVSSEGCRAHAPGIRVVHVGPRGEQQRCRLEIADARGKHQRGVAPVRNQPVVLGLPVRRHGHHLAPLV